MNPYISFPQSAYSAPEGTDPYSLFMTRYTPIYKILQAAYTHRAHLLSKCHLHDGVGQDGCTAPRVGDHGAICELAPRNETIVITIKVRE